MSFGICPEYYNNPDNFIVSVAISNQDVMSTSGHSQPVYSFNETGITIFDLSRNAVEIPVINNLDFQVYISASSVDDDIQYLTPYNTSDYSTAKVMDVGLDHYYFNAHSTGNNGIYFNSTWKTEGLPETIIVNKPNIGLSNTRFDLADKKFSWGSINDDGADAITASLDGPDILWSLTASPSTDNKIIPQLPAAYAEILDINILRPEFISIVDYQNVDGFDAIIEKHHYDDGNFPTLLDYFKSTQTSIYYDLNAVLD